jgi:hypothetical protein
MRGWKSGCPTFKRRFIMYKIIMIDKADNDREYVMGTYTSLEEAKTQLTIVKAKYQTMLHRVFLVNA